MDVRALLASIQPLWLLGAALCVPLSESVDALIFYGMGRSAGCPVKLAGCFDAAYIGEFYYKLGPAGAPVQLKLMYDAGMSATYTASIYTWKAVANTMVYTGYAVAALAYELFWRREGLGPAVAGAGALIALYVFLCGLALFTAVRPGAYSASDPPHPHLPRPPLEGDGQGGHGGQGHGKGGRVLRTAPRPQGQPPDAGGPVRGHVCGAHGPVCHSLLPLPGAGSDRGLFLGAGAGPVPGAGALPHHHAPRQRRAARRGASTCSWAPCSAGIWRWGWCCGALPPFWRFCCWAGPGRCSALRSARRPDTGHRRRTSWMENIPASS